jgi:hypothetical protein
MVLCNRPCYHCKQVATTNSITTQEHSIPGRKSNFISTTPNPLSESMMIIELEKTSITANDRKKIDNPFKPDPCELCQIEIEGYHPADVTIEIDILKPSGKGKPETFYLNDYKQGMQCIGRRFVFSPPKNIVQLLSFNATDEYERFVTVKTNNCMESCHIDFYFLKK